MDSFTESPVKSGHSFTGGNIRDEVDEKRKLEKQNFDLKMKVYYLEENLKRQSHDTSVIPKDIESVEADMTSMRLQLEEKEIELEQRNLLLMKAKGAIEALKGEVTRLKSEGGKQDILEEKIQKMKQASELLEQELRANITQLEFQLSGERDKVHAKDHALAMNEEKIGKLEVSMSVLHDRISDLTLEKERLENRLIDANRKYTDLEDELTQCKAHVDIHRMQTDEQAQETTQVKTMLQEAKFSKQLVEEQYKARIENLVNQHEAELRSVKQLHAQELEAVRREQDISIQQIKDHCHLEITKTRQDCDTKLKEFRGTDAAEFSRARSELADRLQERAEEIRVMRALMETDHRNLDALMKEVDGSRTEIRTRGETIERLRSEATAREEELKVLRRSHELCVELKEAVRKEENEKIQALTRLEQVTSALEDAREAISKQQAGLTSVGLEHQIATRELQELRATASSVAEVCRENERLKSRLEAGKVELLELSHKVTSTLRDVSDGQATIRDLEKRITTNQDEIASLRAEKAALERKLLESSQIVMGESNKSTALDAALNELRNAAEGMRRELEEERRGRRNAEREASDSAIVIRDIKSDLGRSCAVAMEAMRSWDAILTQVLDGNLFQAYTKDDIRGSNGKASDHFDEYSLSSRRSSRADPNSSFFEKSESIGQGLVVIVERLSLKVDRIQRIKHLFEAQGEKLAKALVVRMDGASERVSLAFHKIADAQSRVDSARVLIDRDCRQREAETKEMKRFRDEILNEQANRLKDVEHRYSHQQLLLEQERITSEAANRQAEALRAELSSLTETNASLRADLQALNQTERIVSDLGVRVGELANTNKHVAKELEEKSEELKRLLEFNRVVSAEKMALTVSVERYEAQLKARDDAAREYESKIDSLGKDVERLRSRQINPDLEQTIRQTQTMLQESAGFGSGPLSAVSGKRNGFGKRDQFGESWPGPERLTRSALTTFDQSSEDFERTALVELVGQIDTLVRASADAVTRFDSLTRSHGAKVSSDVISLRQEIWELLEANSRLSLHAQQIALDLRALARRSSTSTNSRPATIFADDTPHRIRANTDDEATQSAESHSQQGASRYHGSATNSASNWHGYHHHDELRQGTRLSPSHQSTGTTGKYATDSNLYFPSRQGVMTTASPKLDELPSSPVPSSIYTNTALRGPDFVQNLRVDGSDRELFSLSSHGLNAQFSSTGNGEYRQGTDSRHHIGSGIHVEATSGLAGRMASGTSTASPVVIRSQFYDTPSSAVEAPHISMNSRITTISPGTLAVSSNRAAQVQSARLSKLGTDLQTLAKKLDSFDISGSNKRK